MNSTIRQSIGIDIAKDSFTACICKVPSDSGLVFSDVVTFDNSKTGFNQLVKWVRKIAVAEAPAMYVMEATGIYYEPLAYHLHRLELNVSVVLPNMVKHYGKSLNIKSKTDNIDARMIARMAAERHLQTWQPPSPVMKQLRDLTRLYSDLKAQKTMFMNRLHSLKAGHEPLPFIVKSTTSVIGKLEQEVAKCLKEIKVLISSDATLRAKVAKLETIKGVGFITVVIIIAETQGFALFKNAKQLASYAGYDVVERESGTSVKGKTRISKKGNSRIRAALHFPALVAGNCNPHFKSIYNRISDRRSSKMIGLVALQRRILTLMHTLWKNDTEYDPTKTSGNQETKPLLRIINEADRQGLSAQDELPLNQSTEALLR
jgi:transposase